MEARNLYARTMEPPTRGQTKNCDSIYHKHAINTGFWLCWGLTTRQPLWVILCRLPEKGRKVIEEIVEEIKERDREERNRNESEETEEIKIFPIYPYLLQG